MVGEVGSVRFDLVVFVMFVDSVLCSGLNCGRHRDSASLYASVSMNSGQCTVIHSFVEASNRSRILWGDLLLPDNCRCSTSYSCRGRYGTHFSGVHARDMGELPAVPLTGFLRRLMLISVVIVVRLALSDRASWSVSSRLGGQDSTSGTSKRAPMAPSSVTSKLIFLTGDRFLAWISRRYWSSRAWMRSGWMSESPLLEDILATCGEIMQAERCLSGRAEGKTKERWQEVPGKAKGSSVWIHKSGEK